MDNFEKYLNDGQESNDSTSDQEIIDLENRLKTRLPDDYKKFLRRINGYEGFLGQSYVRLVGVKDVEEFTDIYCSEIYPNKICIGTNGAGEVFVIEKAGKNQRYGMVPAIGDEKDLIDLGDTIDKFFERLYNGNIF